MSEVSFTVGRYHGLTKAHHGVFNQMPEDHNKFVFVTQKHSLKEHITEFLDEVVEK